MKVLLLHLSDIHIKTADDVVLTRGPKIIDAIKKKAISVGTFSNPATVLGIIDVLGQHVRTDLQTDEIKTLISLY